MEVKVDEDGNKTAGTGGDGCDFCPRTGLYFTVSCLSWRYYCTVKPSYFSLQILAILYFKQISYILLSWL